MSTLTYRAHERFAALFGFGTSFALDYADIATNLIVGIVTGVGVWIITRTLAFAIKKLNQRGTL